MSTATVVKGQESAAAVVPQWLQPPLSSETVNKSFVMSSSVKAVHEQYLRDADLIVASARQVIPCSDSLNVLVAPSLRSGGATSEGGGTASQQQQQQQRVAAQLSPLLEPIVRRLGTILSTSSMHTAAQTATSPRSRYHTSALANGTQLAMDSLCEIIAAVRFCVLVFVADAAAAASVTVRDKRHSESSTTRTRNREAPLAAAVSSTLVTSALVEVVVSVAARFSTVGMDNAPAATPRRDAPPGLPCNASRLAEQELRWLCLFTVAVASQKHAEAILSSPSAVPVLLPDIASIPALLGNATLSQRHPVLTVLLHDRVYRCRAAAEAALATLIQRGKNRLQLALEPAAAPSAAQRSTTAVGGAVPAASRGPPQFQTLATSLGRLLRDMHCIVLHGLTSRETLPYRAIFANILTALVSVTPYAKFPQSQELLRLKISAAPALADMLGKRPDSAEAVSASTFVLAMMRTLPTNPWIAAWLSSPNPSSPKPQSISGGGREVVTLLVHALSPAPHTWRAVLAIARSAAAAFTDAHLEGIVSAAEELVTSVLGGSASAAAASDALRTLMHLCGLAWDAFPNSGSDRAAERQLDDDDDTVVGATNTAGTAASSFPTVPPPQFSVAQRLRVLLRVYARLIHGTDAALRALVYKCLGQIGDEVLSCLPVSEEVCMTTNSGPAKCSHVDPNTTKDTATIATLTLDSVVSWVLDKGTAESDAAARADSFLTLGIWSVKYPTCISATPPLPLRRNVLPNAADSGEVGAAALASRHWGGEFMSVCVTALTRDVDDIVKTKAVFVLSNLCALFHEHNDLSLWPSEDQRRAYVYALCDAAIAAVAVSGRLRGLHGIGSGSPATAVAGHAVRMLQFLLKCLGEDDLIMELAGHPEGAANTFLGLLVAYMQCPPTTTATSGGPRRSRASHVPLLPTWDVKTRWNAAYAIGETLSRPEVYYADPPAARRCFAALLDAVASDSNTKVRSRAAGALAKLFRSSQFASKEVAVVVPEEDQDEDEDYEARPVGAHTTFAALCSALAALMPVSEEQPRVEQPKVEQQSSSWTVAAGDSTSRSSGPERTSSQPANYDEMPATSAATMRRLNQSIEKNTSAADLGWGEQQPSTSTSLGGDAAHLAEDLRRAIRLFLDIAPPLLASAINARRGLLSAAGLM